MLGVLRSFEPVPMRLAASKEFWGLVEFLPTDNLQASGPSSRGFTCLKYMVHLPISVGSHRKEGGPYWDVGEHD
eukprot:1157389-Pelagomonas_calceolata.AAC.3